MILLYKKVVFGGYVMGKWGYFFGFEKPNNDIILGLIVSMKN